jgi:hypothetical protein
MSVIKSGDYEVTEAQKLSALKAQSDERLVLIDDLIGGYCKNVETLQQQAADFELNLLGIKLRINNLLAELKTMREKEG